MPLSFSSLSQHHQLLHCISVFYANDACCMTLTVLFIERTLFSHILVVVLYKEFISLLDHIKFTNYIIFSFEGFNVHVIILIVHTVVR